MRVPDDGLVGRPPVWGTDKESLRRALTPGVSGGDGDRRGSVPFRPPAQGAIDDDHPVNLPEPS